jgi:3-hydroxymyristoyl/3-hydroxydecanoyl-(acyl carrier protein) dehydratase
MTSAGDDFGWKVYRIPCCSHEVYGCHHANHPFKPVCPGWPAVIQLTQLCSGKSWDGVEKACKYYEKQNQRKKNTSQAKAAP